MYSPETGIFRELTNQGGTTGAKLVLVHHSSVVDEGEFFCGKEVNHMENCEEGKQPKLEELEAIQAIIQERKEVNEFLRDYLAMSDSFGIEVANVMFARREEARREIV